MTEQNSPFRVAKRPVQQCKRGRSAYQNGASCKTMKTRTLRVCTQTVTKYDKITADNTEVQATTGPLSTTYQQRWHQQRRRQFSAKI